MAILPDPTRSNEALRRTPEDIARHVAAVAADGDKRTRNPLLRDTLSRIRVDQLAAAAIAAGDAR